MENSPTIFIVPTGIGCEVGGFAGDALPTAKLLASASGCLITHPNVMNGGTLSEKDKNIFYVEGYSLDRLAKGEIALKRVKQQKIGIIFDSAIESEILVRHLQVADACVSTLGINVHSYVVTKKPLNIVIDSDSSKISGGIIENPDTLIDAGKCLIEKGVFSLPTIFGSIFLTLSISKNSSEILLKLIRLFSLILSNLSFINFLASSFKTSNERSSNSSLIRCMPILSARGA